MNFREFVMQGEDNYESYVVADIPPAVVSELLMENTDIFHTVSVKRFIKQIEDEGPIAVSLRFVHSEYQGWATIQGFYGLSDDAHWKVTHYVDYRELDSEIPNVNLTTLQSLL